MTEVIHHQHHKQSPDTTARLLFADFSFVLNTLQLLILAVKLTPYFHSDDQLPLDIGLSF